MVLVIVDRVFNKRTGRSDEVVSHGVDLDTDRIVHLPQCNPVEMGIKFDSEYDEYVIYDYLIR